MGKKNKEFEKERNDLYELRRQLREKEKRIVSRCSHRKKSGKLALRVLSDGRFECKRCGETFSMEQIPGRDISNALRVVHDMINQIRCLTDPDRERDVRISEALGILNFDIKEAAELYERIVRKNSEDREDRDDRFEGREEREREPFGGFGALSFSYEGGKKEKKKKHGYYL